jgi:hypothetical protein
MGREWQEMAADQWESRPRDNSLLRRHPTVCGSSSEGEEGKDHLESWRMGTVAVAVRLGINPF